MTGSTFASSLAGWQNFYLAVASSSAALLGLLFVGVSISLTSMTVAERTDLRTMANLAFSNLLYLLGLSLVMLIPAADVSLLAISFVCIALLGLLRIGRRVVGLVRGGSHAWRHRGTIRRVAWTVAADLLLIFVAVSLAASGDARWLLALTIVVAVLLLGAADVAWALLVREGVETATPPDRSAAP